MVLTTNLNYYIDHKQVDKFLDKFKEFSLKNYSEAPNVSREVFLSILDKNINGLIQSILTDDMQTVERNVLFELVEEDILKIPNLEFTTIEDIEEDEQEEDTRDFSTPLFLSPSF